MKIRLENIRYRYKEEGAEDKDILNGINLIVKEKQWLSIIGRTGAGKSTLVKVIKGLLYPQSGTITYEEQNQVAAGHVNMNVIGYVFQYPEHQLFERNVLADIAFGPSNLGWSKDIILRKAKEVIKAVGLNESYFEKVPYQLSGGEKRRIAIAGVLAMEPKVLVLDEPAAGLDPLGKKEILDLIDCWRKENNVTVLMVTHDLNDVIEYSDKVIVMDEGLIKYEETPEVLFVKYMDKLLEIGIEIPEHIVFMNHFNKKFKTVLNCESLSEEDVMTSVSRFLKRREKGD